MSDGTATLTVTRAEGGTAPYPAVVTADFVREFSVHVNGQAPKGLTPIGCVTPAFSVIIDLQFAETAPDAVNYPDLKCGCL